MVRFFSGTFTAGFIKCFQQRAYDDSLFLRGTIWVWFALSQSWSGTVSYCLVFFFQFIRKYLLADDLRRRREYKGKKRNNIMSISLEKNDFESPSTAWNKLIDSNIAISLFYTLFDRLTNDDLTIDCCSQSHMLSLTSGLNQKYPFFKKIFQH